jgi:hypothetical protein
MASRGLWNAPRPGSDPRLHTKQWRESRAYWKRRGKAEGIRCWRCHGEILYDTWFIPGTKKVHPQAYVLGHKLSRDLGRSFGYDDAWLDSIGNTHPECSRCSARSGYMYQSRKRKAQAGTRDSPSTSTQQPASTPSRSRSAWYGDTTVTIPYSQQAAAASRWQ